MPNASLQTLTRKPLSGSTGLQREEAARQIAREILAEAFSTLRIRVLKPEAISKLRSEVMRREAGWVVDQAA